eukprot:745999-Hanusia_phi.AAC.4
MVLLEAWDDIATQEWTAYFSPISSRSISSLLSSIASFRDVLLFSSLLFSSLPLLSSSSRSFPSSPFLHASNHFELWTYIGVVKHKPVLLMQRFRWKPAQSLAPASPAMLTPSLALSPPPYATCAAAPVTFQFTTGFIANCECRCC